MCEISSASACALDFQGLCSKQAVDFVDQRFNFAWNRSSQSLRAALAYGCNAVAQALQGFETQSDLYPRCGAENKAKQC